MAHAQNCQVLFQLMMLTVMREEEVGLPAGLGPALILLPGGQTVQLQAAPDSLSLTPEQRKYLAKHCVICKQYMPDPTSLKQHIRRKHPHIRIEEAVIQSQCRQLISVEQGKCLFCDKGIKPQQEAQAGSGDTAAAKTQRQGQSRQGQGQSESRRMGPLLGHTVHGHRQHSVCPSEAVPAARGRVDRAAAGRGFCSI